MRMDMAAVISEAGRTPGFSGKTRMRIPEFDVDALDDTPQRLPMKPRVMARKHSRTRYSPLRRALRSMVGQPWNRVFSLFCRRFPPTTMAGQEAYWFLKAEVAKDCFRGADGLMMNAHSYPFYRVDGLYVDPESGLLKYQELPDRYRCRQREALDPFYKGLKSENNWRQVGENEYIENENGIWYHFVVALHMPDEPVPPATTSNCPVLGPKEKAKPHYHRVSKKQLSSKELREMGVRNSLAA